MSEGIQRRQQHPSAEAVLVQSTYQRVICVQEGDERREAGHMFTPERQFLGFTFYNFYKKQNQQENGNLQMNVYSQAFIVGSLTW